MAVVDKSNWRPAADLLSRAIHGQMARLEIAAKPIGDIDNLVVLNGTDGIQEAVFGSIAKGFTALQALRSSLAPGAVAPTAEHNGRADATPEEPSVPERIRRGGAATP